MPDFGLTKGIAKAIRKGASEAKVVRPGEVAPMLDEVAPKIEPATTPVTRPVEEMAADVKVETPTLEPAVADAVAAVPPKRVPIPAETIPETPALKAATEVEATRLSQVELGSYALDESFQTNFDTITTTDGIKAIIADVSEKNAGKIDEARRGIIGTEQLRGLAADLDVDETVVRSVMERETGGVLAPEVILAARQVLNSSAERIHTLAKKVATGQATDMDRLTFRRQMDWHREYQTQFMGARAEAGRALNAFKIPTGADIDVSQIKEMVEGVNGRDTDRIAKAISMMDNPKAVNKAVRKYTQSKVMGVTNEVFINGILSGIKTFLVNVNGNALFQAMNIAETAVAARIGRFFSAGEHAAVGEASALLHGTLGAWRDGFRLAARSFRTGTALDDVVKFEGTRRRSITAEHLLSPEQQNTTLGKFVDAVGTIIRIPTERVMLPTDEFFKTLAYRAELERQAFSHVYAQLPMARDSATAAGVQFDALEFAERTAREFMENAPLTAQKAADDYTRYVTFQNPLGEIAQKWQLALRSMPVLSLIAPFIRTPVNIFKAGILDRSPVALATPKFWDTMKKGGRERDMALARVSMGTATSALVAYSVMDGTITGAGPSNFEARSLLEAQGWRPYSVRVVDDNGNATYHSYARAEPLAFVIGATADAVELMSYLNEDIESFQDDSQEVNNAIASIIVGVANNTMSKTFMKGMADFTEAISDPKRYASNYFRQLAPALVPFSSLRNQIGQMQDPYMREAWTVLDKIKAQSGIPGYSQGAPPRRDVFGNPRKYAAGSLIGTMSPMPDSSTNNDPILAEVLSVMNQSRIVPITMPEKRMDGLRLTATEYDQLVVLSRTMPAANGDTFYDALQKTIDTSVYQNATPHFRAELLRDVQTRYDGMARDTLKNPNSPGFQPEYLSLADRFAEFEMKQKRLKGQDLFR